MGKYYWDTCYRIHALESLKIQAYLPVYFVYFLALNFSWVEFFQMLLLVAVVLWGLFESPPSPKKGIWKLFFSKFSS